MKNRQNSHGLSGRSVLVVEDEYYIADDLARALGRVGAKVVGPASTLEEAERLLAESPVDCAVLDLKLDRETTYDLAARLKREGVPVIIASGYSPAAVDEPVACDAHVEKPYDPERVLSLSAQLLSR